MRPPVALAVLVLALAVASAPARALEKWLYSATNLQVNENVDKLDSLWRRAKAAGYTHILLVDSKMAKLGDLGAMTKIYFNNVARVKKLAAELKLELVPAVAHIGYSNNMLWHDPNLIEALPVKDAPLVVQGGVARLATGDVPSLPALTDTKKWSWKDENVVIDGDALRVTDPKGANARITKTLKLQPYRQYHVSVRVKTQDFKASPEIKALPAAKGSQSLNWANLGVKPTQDWTEHHAVFNSLEGGEVNLMFGVWGGSTGSLWWKDAKFEEVAFVNLTRRPGTPLTIKTADGKTLTEGRDFEALTDPQLGSKPWKGAYTVYHEPPVLRTKLADGTKLVASYYHGVTVYDGQASICPSEPKTMELIRDEMKRVHAAFGAKHYMMSHDEVRVLNWCKACTDRKLTPGQILAQNVKECAEALRQTAPGARIHVWSDMFDPHHNAVKGPYYLVNGSLENSWEGLPKEVVILPWYFEKRAESLKFFADRGHRQVIAGYYDHKPEQIVEWLQAGKGLPGILGVMYTTWQNKYSDVEKFAQAVDSAVAGTRSR